MNKYKFLAQGTFEEYLKNNRAYNKRHWTELARELLESGNRLEHGNWHVAGFKALSYVFHSYVWQLSHREDGKGWVHSFTTDIGDLSKICDDPAQWTANEVALPEIYNAYAHLVNELQNGVWFRANNGAWDYMGGEMYEDTLWFYRLGDYLVHEDNSEEYPSVFDNWDDEYDPRTNETHYVSFYEPKLMDYLFSLHSKHSLLTFKACEADELTRSIYEKSAKTELKRRAE